MSELYRGNDSIAASNQNIPVLLHTIHLSAVTVGGMLQNATAYEPTVNLNVR